MAKNGLIEPKKPYSLLEAEKITTINRLTLRRYIEKGEVKSRAVGSGQGKRYVIMGADLKLFNERFQESKKHRGDKLMVSTLQKLKKK